MLSLNTRARFHAPRTASVAHAFSRSLRLGGLIAFSLGALAACSDSTPPLDTTYDNPVLPQLVAYASGSYLVSPRKKTGVPSPLPGVTLAVPDVYSARAGLAYALAPKTGTSVNLGLRIDGIPLRDVVGGADDGFRRPGHTLYLDPGVAAKIGKQELTLSVPIRLSQNFSRSPIDRERNFRGGGDLANYLIFAGYSVRF